MTNVPGRTHTGTCLSLPALLNRDTQGIEKEACLQEHVHTNTNTHTHTHTHTHAVVARCYDVLYSSLYVCVCVSLALVDMHVYSNACLHSTATHL